MLQSRQSVKEEKPGEVDLKDYLKQPHASLSCHCETVNGHWKKICEASSPTLAPLQIIES